MSCVSYLCRHLTYLITRQPLAITIYHNGECSKCRGALEIMQEQGIPHTPRWYLSDPLNVDELAALLKKLNMQPSQIVRKNEPLYKEQYEGRTITEAEWLHVLAANPVLIERPIVETDHTAIIARPPEKLLELLKNSQI